MGTTTWAHPSFWKKWGLPLCFVSGAFYVQSPGGCSRGDGSPGTGLLFREMSATFQMASRAMTCPGFGVPDTGLPTCPDDGGCLAGSSHGAQPQVYSSKPPLPPTLQHFPPLLPEPLARGVWPLEASVSPQLFLPCSLVSADVLRPLYPPSPHPPAPSSRPAVRRWGWRCSGLSPPNWALHCLSDRN